MPKFAAKMIMAPREDYPVSMQVKVLFFGVLKDITGKSIDFLDMPDNSGLQEMLVQYCASFPPLARLLPSIAISINRDYAASDSVLHDGDEVALLPPVSGGTGDDQEEGSTGEFRCTLIHDVIDVQETSERIKKPSDGAISMFEGIVRDNSRGRKTLYLDYEAYETMALKQMGSLACEAVRQFRVRDVAMVHRLGRLNIGETSVLIVVASAHRREGLDACRWLIDTFKRTVPIWKKEYFEDGALWTDGEAFPEELSRGPKHQIGASNPAPED